MLFAWGLAVVLLMNGVVGGISRLLKVLMVDGRAKCPVVGANVVAALETCVEELFPSLSV